MLAILETHLYLRLSEPINKQITLKDSAASFSGVNNLCLLADLTNAWH